MRGRLPLFAAFLAVCAAGTVIGEPLRYTVIGDRVNLRTRAEDTSEVVHQLNAGDIVEVTGMADGWASIVPPEGVSFWVHQDFIDGDRVQPNELNVRSGAGINYHTVGSLRRGERVNVKGAFGEWLKIDPPTNSTLFVSMQYVDPVPPERPKPQPLPPAGRMQKPPEPQRAYRAATTNRVRESSKAEAQQTTRYLPKDLDLVPLPGQGKTARKQGVLRAVSFLERAPARYRLIEPVGTTYRTVCFIKGNKRQLKGFVGQRLTVQGAEYWVQGETVPVIVPELIVPKR